jgi:hypothetical protein
MVVTHQIAFVPLQVRESADIGIIVGLVNSDATIMVLFFFFDGSSETVFLKV